MTGADLVELVQQKLGDESRRFYTTALCTTFVNFAQALLVALPQYTLLRRTATTIPAGGCFIDLREVIPNYLTIRRVVLGDVATQEETLQYGLVRRLKRTDLVTLAARRQWIAATDVPERYFLVGSTILGVHPRPISDTIITIMTEALPTPYTTDTLTLECDLLPSNHPFVADVATGLLLMREGAAEAKKGLAMLAQVLPGTLLQGLAQALGNG